MEDIQRLVEGLPQAAVLIGADGRVAQMNPAATALFGAGAVGRHHGIVLRQPQALAAIGAALTLGQGGAARIVLPGQAPGQDQVLEAHVIALDSGAAIVFQDLSAAEAVEGLHRDFVANVSHELRTPLTALSGFVETLRGPARDDPSARVRFLDIMAAEAARMNRLVGDLLQLSRVEAMERVRPEGLQDLSALAAETVAALRPLADGAGVRIVLLGADEACLVPADRDQILQVLSNLIENAVKYGTPRGGAVTVALGREGQGPRGPWAVIEVRDEGEGIDPRHLPRLTERFYRVDSHRSREMGGTGLGLAIVKHIVARHRGRLVIESAPGKGSCFKVLLPTG